MVIESGTFVQIGGTAMFSGARNTVIKGGTFVYAAEILPESLYDSNYCDGILEWLQTRYPSINCATEEQTPIAEVYSVPRSTPPQPEGDISEGVTDIPDLRLGVAPYNFQGDGLAPGSAHSFAGANDVRIYDGHFINVGHQSVTSDDRQYYITHNHFPLPPNDRQPHGNNIVPWIAVASAQGLGHAFYRLLEDRTVTTLSYSPATIDRAFTTVHIAIKDHPLPSLCLSFLILQLFRNYRSRPVP